MREAAGAWTEAYPVMEYRHGPISVTGPGRVAWWFGDPADLPAGLAGRSTAPVDAWWPWGATRWPIWSSSSGWPPRSVPHAASTRTRPAT